MRIPSSVIVMSLVTAVPFALAVRDTVKPHPKTYDQMSPDEREAQLEEEMRKESAEQARREAAESAKRAATYKTYFGEKPARLGSFFGSVHLGTPAGDPAAEALREATGATIELEGEHTVDAIRISDDEHCDALKSATETAWQASVDGVYLDAATHQRASFHDCTLTFDRYVEVNQWIDRKGEVPVALDWIGMSADKLREQLGDRLENDDGEVLMWSAPGVGRGEDVTHITARVDNARIAGMSINVMTDPATIDAIHARLDGLLGKAAPDPDDPGTLQWKGKLHASLVASEGTLSLELSR